MSVWNKLKKLRRMSGDEIRQRLSKKVNERRERHEWRLRTNVNRSTVNSSELLVRCARIVPGCQLPTLDALQETHSELLDDLKQCVKSHADSILSGQWTMLGHAFDLTGEIDWHSDVRTGFQWDRTFHADLPLYALPGDGDIKYPWELSRHQYLCELGLNFGLNGCESSARLVRKLLLDWISENPLYEGVNWTSGLEAGMRVISWVWGLAPLTTWDGWQDDDLAAIAASLWDHAEYLSGNFSYFSSPYNHLIGEATGLLYAASLFPAAERTRLWNDQACRVLLEHGPKQFYDDGYCVEQAMGYHYYTLGFLSAGWLAAKEFGRPLDALSTTMKLAFQTGKAFRRADGTWPAIGDLDSARALPLKPDVEWSFDSLQQLAAVMFDDPSLKIGNAGPGRELLLLTGNQGLSKWQAMEEMDESGSVTKVFSDSGYAVGRCDDEWVCFDAGPVAHGLFPDATPSTAHGHADTLQVLYHFEGEDVLADAGMPYYGGDQDWVRYFRSAQAHNTVSIEGAEFVQRAGRLAWSHEVKRPRMEVKFTDECWLFAGSLAWPGIKHSRYVCCLPGRGMWIADWIVSDEPRNVVWYWQLPDEPIELDGQSANWRNMSFEVSATGEQKQLRLLHAREDHPEGWRCWGYGQRHPANRLTVRDRVEKELMVLTSIGKSARPPVSAQIGRSEIGQSEQATPSELRLGECCWNIDSDFWRTIREGNVGVADS